MSKYKLAIRSTKAVIREFSTMEQAFNGKADAESLDRKVDNYDDDRYMILEYKEVS